MTVYNRLLIRILVLEDQVINFLDQPEPQYELGAKYNIQVVNNYLLLVDIDWTTDNLLFKLDEVVLSNSSNENKLIVEFGTHM